jgi:hypothetical protein
MSVPALLLADHGPTATLLLVPLVHSRPTRRQAGRQARLAPLPSNLLQPPKQQPC